MAMITDYVPGAYMTHDMLHMRGGHQVSWLIDGVEIPNTNIASNLAAQIDPKDIDYIEVQRGSYTSDIGDRTYGVFNVVPRTGFERNRQAELVLTAGNFFQTDDQLNFGDHTEKFAYYASLNGNRSDYGLAPPVGQVLHDATNGYGGFASLIYNRTPKDQFRLVTQLRNDFFQIPYDPDPNSFGNQQFDSSGLRDGQHETDAIVAFSWLHTFNPSTVLQVSPFYHYNRADYELQPQRHPRRHHRRPHLQLRRRASLHHHRQSPATPSRPASTPSASTTTTSSAPSSTTTAATPTSPYPTQPPAASSRSTSPTTSKPPPGSPSSPACARPTSRASSPKTTPPPASAPPSASPNSTGSSAASTAASTSPRRSSPPPAPSCTSPTANNTDLAPLHGERDEEHQFGVQIPFRGWLLDADTFKTRVNNFLDHSNIGDSSIYFPVTVDGALIRAWELTLRCPRLWHLGQSHLAYSNQIAEQRGAITGGLICTPVGLPPCDVGPGYTPVDHDQRNTLNVGFNATLPRHIFASTNVYYGSGFANGGYIPTPASRPRYPNPYLPQHTTFDLALGKTFGENTHRLRHRHQRRQPPRPARQQPHLRRLPLQRPPPDLRRTPLPLQVLRLLKTICNHNQHKSHSARSASIGFTDAALRAGT